MGELWWPEAHKDELKNSGYMLTAYPWRGVIHTTEGGSYAGARSAYVSNNSAPHFTVSYERAKFQAWQHIPLNRAARTMRNVGGGVETNRLRCIQFEIVGFAAKSQDFGSDYLNGIGRLMRWIEANTTIQRHSPRFYGTDAGFILASANARQRMTFAEWNAFNGWCGHQHVPENDHWDPGKINIGHLLGVSVPVPAPTPPLIIDIGPEEPVQRRMIGPFHLDNNGNGWLHIKDVPWVNFRDVHILGSYPPSDGYWPIPRWGVQQRDPGFVIELTNGQPGQSLNVFVDHV